MNVNLIGVWQSESGTVFKLKETGKSKKVDGEWVPELTNDVMFRVSIANDTTSTGPAVALKETFLAEQIAKVLNEHLSPG